MDLKFYEEVSNLGEGSFGFVKLVKHKSTRKLFAIKILSKKDIQKKGQVSHTLDEIKILRQLDNPYFVKFREELQDRRFIYLVMEYVPGGDIF